jgi:threonine dehydratase
MDPWPSPPLVRLSNLLPGKAVFAKCEFLAPSGCFKIRGATYLLDHLTRVGKRPQLIVPSMGNTALGVAVAAKAYGFTMVGVVPQTISRAKDQKLQALGVELMKIAGGGSELLAAATRVAEERGGYFVHPHLDSLWTDGYQAIAGEILETVPDCKTLVFPLGGGGLLMGLTEYLLKHDRKLNLVGCEPRNYPTYAPFDYTRSATIADGLLLDVPHPKVERRIHDMKIKVVLVEEADIRRALADLYFLHGLIAEPSSVITLAHIKKHLGELPEPICAVLTGENIAREDFWRLTGS